VILRRDEQRLGARTQQQILALGRLGWTLSRIQGPTGVRRGTISGYLKAR
jgi:hypothetical protein